MRLRSRATETERLDVGVAEWEALESLADLRFVNRWLGGERHLLAAVLRALEGEHPRLLDVGCGSADLPAAVRARVGPRLLAVGLDAKLLHVREAPAGITPVVADVRRLPFAPRSFDVVTASLFLHHFDDAEVGFVLQQLFAVARRALVINDLRRAQAPYWFGRALFGWLFRSRVSVDDGLLSIRRAFTEAELSRAFAAAGIAPVRVQRRFPYRLVAIAERPPA